MLIAELVDVVQCTRTRLNNGRPIVPMLKLNFAWRNKRCLNRRQQQSGYLMAARMMDHSSKLENASRVSPNCVVMETAFRKPVIMMRLLLAHSSEPFLERCARPMCPTNHRTSGTSRKHALLSITTTRSSGTREMFRSRWMNVILMPVLITQTERRCKDDQQFAGADLHRVPKTSLSSDIGRCVTTP